MGNAEEWTDWDHALVTALQVIEDYTDEYGLLAWEREDDAVEIDAVKKIHKFKAAMDSRTKGSPTKPYVPTPGEYFIPEVWSRRKDNEGNGVFQTYGEWLEREQAKRETEKK